MSIRPFGSLVETLVANRLYLTLEQGFLPMGQLKLGMHIVRVDGRVGVVTGWKVVAGTKVMYNLEVAQDQTFVVGAGSGWCITIVILEDKVRGSCDRRGCT